jgi:hypothetical protein
MFAAAAWYSQISTDFTAVVVLTAIGYLVLAYLDRRLLWAFPAAVVSATALLIKYNVGVACTGAFGIWAAIELASDRAPRRLVALTLLASTYCACLLGLFRVYGGPWDAIGSFLRASGQIAAGYSSQMSTPGSMLEEAIPGLAVALAVVCSVAGICFRAQFTPVLLVILFPLFVLYKGATVRHDEPHLLISIPPMVGLSAFLLSARGGRLQCWAAQALVALGLSSVIRLPPPDWSHPATRGATAYTQLCTFTQTRSDVRAGEAQVKKQLAIPDSMRARIGSAKVDIYPWDLCYVTANGLNWKPRFVFQSYSAYHPDLDHRCAESYSRDDAPEYILYTHQAIDSEHPCIVDPLTWIELLRWYDAVEEQQNLILLQRRAAPRWREADALGTRAVAFGERCLVPPDDGGPVFLRAKLRLSAVGRLLNLLYKVDPPTIRVEYQDGAIADHRLVWQNVRSGFLVSSLPRDNSGVKLLLEGRQTGRVRAVTLLDEHGSFSRTFRIVWSRALSRPGPPATPTSESVATAGRAESQLRR